MRKITFIVLLLIGVTQLSLAQLTTPFIIMETNGKVKAITPGGDSFNAEAADYLYSGNQLKVGDESSALIFNGIVAKRITEPGTYTLNEELLANESTRLRSFDPIFGDFSRNSLEMIVDAKTYGGWAISTDKKGDGWGAKEKKDVGGWGKDGMDIHPYHWGSETLRPTPDGWGAKGSKDKGGWGAKGNKDKGGWGSKGSKDKGGWGASPFQSDSGFGVTEPIHIGGWGAKDKTDPGGWGAKGSKDKGGWGAKGQKDKGGWGSIDTTFVGGWGAKGSKDKGGWGAKGSKDKGGWGAKGSKDKGGWGSKGSKDKGGWGYVPPSKKGGWGSKGSKDKGGWGKDDLTTEPASPGGMYLPKRSKVKWIEHDDVDRYLFVIVDTTGALIYSEVSDNGSVAFDFSDLEANKMYYWQVLADGKQTVSPPMTFKVMDEESYTDAVAKCKKSKMYKESGMPIQLMMLSLACEESGLYLNANEIYQSLLKVAKTNDLVKVNYTGFLLRMGQYEKARKVAEKI